MHEPGCERATTCEGTCPQSTATAAPHPSISPCPCLQAPFVEKFTSTCRGQAAQQSSAGTGAHSASDLRTCWWTVSTVWQTHPEAWWQRACLDLGPPQQREGTTASTTQRYHPADSGHTSFHTVKQSKKSIGNLWNHTHLLVWCGWDLLCSPLSQMFCDRRRGVSIAIGLIAYRCLDKCP